MIEYPHYTPGFVPSNFLMEMGNGYIKFKKSKKSLKRRKDWKNSDVERNSNSLSKLQILRKKRWNSNFLARGNFLLGQAKNFSTPSCNTDKRLKGERQSKD